MEDIETIRNYVLFNFPSEVREEIKRHQRHGELTVAQLAADMHMLPNALWNRLSGFTRFTLVDGLYLMKRFDINPYREEDTCSTTSSSKDA